MFERSRACRRAERKGALFVLHFFRSVVAETGDGYMQVPSRMLLGATVKTYQVVAQ